MEGSRSIIGASDELSDIFCEPCEKIQQQKTADGFCVDCSEYLCGPCFSYHKRCKSFENHVLQDKSKMPWDRKNVKTKDICIEKCHVHMDKVTEYFCASCDKAGCHVCMTIDHRKCNISHIPDIVKGLKTTEEFRSFERRLDNLHDNLQHLQDTVDKNFKATYDMNETALSDLEKQSDKIKVFFNQLYEKVEMDIVNKKNEDKRSFEVCSKDIIVLQKDLHDLKFRRDTLKKNGQNCELFIFIKNARLALKKVSNDVMLLSKNGKVSKVKYKPSEDVENMRKHIKELGSLVVGGSETKDQNET
ncbi:E3 ubiquitin-protein ligase TRIM33-like, partial [Mercenaria mercenaria]|uniref:E3 ubiquitin-protein ligase TRIM33-like n=1 Tax=Mercenaria mercenaria TaxID=6596 RepID=UPI00234E4D43